MTIASDPLTRSNPPATPPVPVEPALRFCPACGAPWQPRQLICPGCAHALAAPGEPPTPTSGDAGDAASIRAAIAFYFSLLGVSLVVTLAMAAARRQATVAWYVGIDAALAVLIIGWCIAQRRHILPLLARVGTFRWYAAAIAWSGFTFALADAVISLLQRVGGQASTYTDTFAAAGYGIWLPVLLIAVQPAIFEELAFRGSIQASLQSVLGRRESVVVTATMFAILHLSVFSLPHLIVLGLVLGWLRHASGSLYPAMLLHFMHNSLVLVDERCGGLLPW